MFEQVFKNIDDVLWKEAGSTTELDYTEQTSWMLFLKYLDDLEQERAEIAELRGYEYRFIIGKAYRWGSWAAPKKTDGSFDHDAALVGDDERPDTIGYFKRYSDKNKQEFLEFVLDHYFRQGVGELDQDKLPELLELKYRALPDAFAILGKADQIIRLFIDFQEHLYAKHTAA